MTRAAKAYQAGRVYETPELKERYKVWSINDVTILGSLSTESVMKGRGVKNIKICVTSFMDGPYFALLFGFFLVRLVSNSAF